MSLDATTRRQLVEARERIIAQLDELEFRVTGNRGAWRQRGPEDRGDVYDALKSELREISHLLEPEDEAMADDQGESSKFVPPSQPVEWPSSEPGTIGRLWAILQIALLVITLGVAVASSFR